jgi:tripartite-type tricarboxylate transporter receptor subunit TctC
MTKKASFLKMTGMAMGAVAAIGLLSTQQVSAADFSNKRIRVIVPFSEGGGTDSLTRFLQPFFEKYLPGNPKVLVINKPGGGSIVGGNYFQKRAKHDGTWVMAVSSSTVANYVIKDPRIKFVIEKWNPIALLPRGAMVYVHEKLGVHKIKGIKAKIKHMRKFPTEQLVFGGKTPTSSGLNKRMALSVLGIEVKSVWGMKGNGPMALAFERGEFTVNFDNSLSYLNNRKHLRKAGIAKEFLTLGAPDVSGKWGRDPVWPNVPTVFEMYKALHGKEISGPAGDALRGHIALTTAGNKSYHLPEKVSKEVLATWHDAFRKLMKDPKFLKKRKKIIGDYQVLVGKPAADLLYSKLNIPENAKAYLSKYVKKRYGISLNL